MRIYLDWNATTPLAGEVLAAMQTAGADAWGNPASVHAYGRAARARVEDAREALAAVARVDPRDVVFTSGGTEANNLALRSAFPAGATRRLVTSRLEHPSITRVAEALESEGRARVRWITVTPGGTLDLDDLRHALAEDDTWMIAVQAVNHETGVRLPIPTIAALAREHGATLHIDAVQAWGKIDVDESAGDTRSLAGHKLRGPKGIGALFARPGTRLSPVLHGGAQERGLRPGTVDPVASAGLAVAARRAVSGPERYARVAPLRDALEARLLGVARGAAVNGNEERAPHVTNVAFPGWAGPELVAALDLEGVAISSGSACSAGTSEPSAVLRAMVGEERAARSVRISLGEETTPDDVELAAAAFERVLRRGA